MNFNNCCEPDLNMVETGKRVPIDPTVSKLPGSSEEKDSSNGVVMNVNGYSNGHSNDYNEKSSLIYGNPARQHFDSLDSQASR